MRNQLPPEKGTAMSPHFRPMSVVVKGWLDQDATLYGGTASGHATLYQMLTQIPQKGAQRPQFSAHVYYGQTVAHLSNCCAVVE